MRNFHFAILPLIMLIGGCVAYDESDDSGTMQRELCGNNGDDDGDGVIDEDDCDPIFADAGDIDAGVVLGEDAGSSGFDSGPRTVPCSRTTSTHDFVEIYFFTDVAALYTQINGCWGPTRRDAEDRLIIDCSGVEDREWLDGLAPLCERMEGSEHRCELLIPQSTYPGATTLFFNPYYAVRTGPGTLEEHWGAEDEGRRGSLHVRYNCVDRTDQVVDLRNARGDPNLAFVLE